MAMPTYVIGITPNNLLNVEYTFYVNQDYDITGSSITSIDFGILHLSQATFFSSLDAAKAAVKEIKDRYHAIFVQDVNIIEGIINRDNFDPYKLKIYSIGIISNIEED
jgi:hypothetical protein